MDKFLDCLLAEEKRIKSILKHVTPTNVTVREGDNYQNAVHCHISEDELGQERVRNHNHLTGNFRGQANYDCNLNHKFSNRIPLIFHNLKNFDGYLLVRTSGKIKDKPLGVIPLNEERYFSFSIGDLPFIDSLQFLNASLETLVSNLAKEVDEKFQVLKRFVDKENVHLLLRKG